MATEVTGQQGCGRGEGKDHKKNIVHGNGILKTGMGDGGRGGKTVLRIKEEARMSNTERTLFSLVNTQKREFSKRNEIQLTSDLVLTFKHFC